MLPCYQQFDVQKCFVLKMCLDTHTHNRLDIMPLESIPVYHRRVYMSVGPTDNFLGWMKVTFISLPICAFVCVSIFHMCNFMFSQNFHAYRKLIYILYFLFINSFMSFINSDNLKK